MSDDRGTLQVVAEHLAAALEPRSTRRSATIESFRQLLFGSAGKCTACRPRTSRWRGRRRGRRWMRRTHSPTAPTVDEALALSARSATSTAPSTRSLSRRPASTRRVPGDRRTQPLRVLLVEYLLRALPSSRPARAAGRIHYEDVDPPSCVPASSGPASTGTAPRVAARPRRPSSAEVLGWGTPDFDFRRTAELLSELALAIGLPSSLDHVGAPTWERRSRSRPPRRPSDPIAYRLHRPSLRRRAARRTGKSPCRPPSCLPRAPRCRGITSHARPGRGHRGGALRRQLDVLAALRHRPGPAVRHGRAPR